MNPVQRKRLFTDWIARSPLLPAPMCNYSDRPQRELLRVMGAHVVWTEMYSSEAMTRGDPKTERLMDYRGEPGPLIVQIFGTRPDLMAEAARIVVRLGADGVDLNLGCPAKKIMRAGSGAALAENQDQALRVVEAIRDATDVPFTVKMRWQPNGAAIRLAKACQDIGVEAVTLHARTWQQQYGGTANWEWIAEMKEALRIPVIGNGDVTCAADAIRMRLETGCDAVMVGRAITGNPWLMRDAANLNAQNAAEVPADYEPLVPEDNERLRVLMIHAELMWVHRKQKGMFEFRKHCAGYVKGLPGARQARPELMQTTSLEEIAAQLKKHFDYEWEGPTLASG